MPSCGQKPIISFLCLNNFWAHSLVYFRFPLYQQDTTTPKPEVRKSKLREQREFEAETTAFLVAQNFGIKTKLKAAVYIKSWFPENMTDVIEKSFSEIFEAAKKIIERAEN